jgi:hypothetical protein
MANKKIVSIVQTSLLLHHLNELFVMVIPHAEAHNRFNPPPPPPPTDSVNFLKQTILTLYIAYCLVLPVKPVLPAGSRLKRFCNFYQRER